MFFKLLGGYTYTIAYELEKRPEGRHTALEPMWKEWHDPFPPKDVPPDSFRLYVEADNQEEAFTIWNQKMQERNQEMQERKDRKRVL